MSLLNSAYRIHQLCLDAPAVAVSAYWMVCRLDGRVADGATMIIVFLTVWLAYVGDRWMDAQRHPRAALHSPRHRVFVQNPIVWQRVWCAVLVLDVVISVLALSVGSWLYGLLLGAMSVAYTVGTQRRIWKGPQKEIIIGILFGLVAGGFAPWDWTVSSICALIAVGCACALNCMAVSWNERELDSLRGELSAFSADEGQRRTIMALAILAGLTAMWVSIPFAFWAVVYLAGLAWLLNRRAILSQASFSLIADWGVLFVFLLAGVWG
ncbi:MAG: hypothetical protein ACPGN3_08485 [Opitutales bacterium]